MLLIPKKSSRYFNTVPRHDVPVEWATVQTLGPKVGMTGAGVMDVYDQPQFKCQTNAEVREIMERKLAGEGLGLAGGAEEALIPGDILREQVLAELPARVKGGQYPAQHLQRNAVNFDDMEMEGEGFIEDVQRAFSKRAWSRRNMKRAFSRKAARRGINRLMAGPMRAARFLTTGRGMPVTKDRFKKIIVQKAFPLMLSRFARVGLRPTYDYGGRMKRDFSRHLSRVFARARMPKKIQGQGIGAAIASVAASVLPELLPLLKKGAKAIWGWLKKLFRKRRGKRGGGLKLSGQGSPMTAPRVQKVISMIGVDLARIIKKMRRANLERMSGRGIGSFFKTAFKKVAEFFKRIFKRGKKLVKKGKAIYNKVAPQVKKAIKIAKPLVEKGIELLPPKQRQQARNIQKKVEQAERFVKTSAERGRTIVKKLAGPTRELMTIASNLSK